MTPQDATPAAVAVVVNQSDYVRERQLPHPDDSTYLHLRDLRSYLQQFQTTAALRVLDYGCGGSPYRDLFPAAHYCRADAVDTPDLDYALDARGCVPAPDSSFDLVLSNQVLEHVPDPASYLRESFRLLVPGGRLILTTHGFYEEHGCPGDYHRWTADGLRLAVERAGFEVETVCKLTCGGRALLQLLSHHHGDLFGPRWHPFGLAAALVRGAFRRSRGFIHRCSDRFQSQYRVVSAAEQGHVLCLGLGICATKRGVRGATPVVGASDSA